MLFLVALFLFKTTSIFKNNENKIDKQGLTYKNEVLVNLVYQDTDLDGVADWEESLWGLDPSKKETTPGIPDSTVASKLRTEQGGAEGTGEYTENLTETDKFSRELFSTVAALNQNGAMDQETLDKLSTSLAENIKNSSKAKVYTLSDIKVTQDNSIAAVKKYDDTMDSINKKYPVNAGVIDILQRFIIDENNVDVSVLTELDLIIIPTEDKIAAISQMTVPQYISSLHLDFLNALEKFLENIKDIRLYDSDPVVALGAIGQLEQSITVFESSIIKLKDAIYKKLNN